MKNNILFRNLSTSDASFIITAPEETADYKLVGKLGTTYEENNSQGRDRLDVKMSAFVELLKVIKADLVFGFEGQIAVEIDGELQPYSYKPTNIVEGLNGVKGLTVVKLPVVEGTDGVRFKISNDEPVGSPQIRIYPVTAETSVSLDDDMNNQVTWLDEAYVNFGVTLPMAYSVSCEGAIPYAGLIRLNGVENLNNEPANFTITNGKKGAKVQGTLEDLAEALSNNFDVQAYEVATDLSAANEGIVDLFVVNTAPELNVDFKITVEEKVLSFMNVGVEGAVAVDEEDPRIVSVCLSGQTGIGSENPYLTFATPVKNDLILKGEEYVYSNGLTAVALNKMTLDEGRLTASLDQEINEERGGVSAYIESANARFSGIMFRNPEHTKIATLIENGEGWGEIRKATDGDGEITWSYMHDKMKGEILVASDVHGNISTGNEFLTIHSDRFKMPGSEQVLLSIKSPVVGLTDPLSPDFEGKLFYLNIGPDDETNVDILGATGFYVSTETGLKPWLAVLDEERLLLGKMVIEDDTVDPADQVYVVDFASMISVTVGDGTISNLDNLIITEDKIYLFGNNEVSTIIFEADLPTNEEDLKTVNFTTHILGRLLNGISTVGITSKGTIYCTAFNGLVTFEPDSSLIKTYVVQRNSHVVGFEDSDTPLIFCWRHGVGVGVIAFQTYQYDNSSGRTLLLGENSFLDNGSEDDDTVTWLNNFLTNEVGPGCTFLMTCAEDVEKDLKYRQPKAFTFGGYDVVNGGIGSLNLSVLEDKTHLWDFNGPLVVLNESVDPQSKPVSLYQVTETAENLTPLESNIQAPNVIVDKRAFGSLVHSPFIDNPFDGGSDEVPYIGDLLIKGKSSICLKDGSTIRMSDGGEEGMFQEAGLFAIDLVPAESTTS